MRWSGAVLVVSVVFGCSDVAPTPVQIGSNDTEPEQVTERRPNAAPADKRGAFGAACSDAEGCLSGICLHVDQTSRLEGRRCAQRCTSDFACEAGQCLQIFPADDGWFCVPEAR